MTLDDKQLKRAKQEAAQKTSQIRKSGLPFYCAILEESQGDMAAVLAGMTAANAVVKNKTTGEIIRDLTADVGKLFLSSDDDRLVVVTYVPAGRALTAAEWCQRIVTKYGGTINVDVAVGDDMACGTIPNDPNAGIYVFKLRDQIVSEEYAALRSAGLLREAADEDDELYGDDVFE